MLPRSPGKVAVLFFVLTFLFIPITIRAETHSQAKTDYPVVQKGMSYVVWADDKLSRETSEESLEAMAAAGVTSVEVVVRWYQDKYNSIRIYPNECSPSDASVRHVIKTAHAMGMSVMLKPQIGLIDIEDSPRPADIGFQNDDDWNRWGDSYVKFVTHYAELAEATNAEMFCIGTDLTFAASRTGMWKGTIIPEVRKVFPGSITYAANWDDYMDVGFWDDLDYAGINAFFPLTDKDSPTFDDVLKGWKKWAGKIESWQKMIRKPVIFTECGYPSTDSAAKRPWEEPISTRINTGLQADCYRALFETFWDKKWFYGTYWWNWNTYPASDGESLEQFTPQNKAALLQIRKWYVKPITAKSFTEAGPITAEDIETGQRLLESRIIRGIPAVKRVIGINATKDLPTISKKKNIN